MLDCARLCWLELCYVGLCLCYVGLHCSELRYVGLCCSELCSAVLVGVGLCCAVLNCGRIGIWVAASPAFIMAQEDPSEGVC